MAETSPEYQKGYKAALAHVRKDLAAVLRAHALKTGVGDLEVLSEKKIREIFTQTFGVMAADLEFGPEPELAGLDGAEDMADEC